MGNNENDYSIARWLAHHASWQGEKIALRFKNEKITYFNFNLRVQRLSSMLRDTLGLSVGDRIAYLGYNSPYLLDLLFASSRMGIILVPLNWRLAAYEHTWIIKNSGTAALFVETDFISHIEQIKNDIPETILISYQTTYFPKAWKNYDSLLEKTVTRNHPESLKGNTPLLLVYTSGTTGHPKGALLNQKAIFYNATNSITAHDLTSKDHILTVLPMFHVGGLNIYTTPGIYAGATITITERFDPGETLRIINEDRPSVFLAVPTVISSLLAHPEWNDTDISSLRLVGTGASSVPKALLRAWLSRGITATQIYGLTESAPVAICLPAENAETHIGSAGKPVINCLARIVDNDGKELKPYEKGEIQLKGPNIFSKYWKDPQGTKEAFISGWFRTGDLGHTDNDGFFYVDDRKTDVIISGGENIYPAELESILDDCQEIRESAIVAKKDPQWGEIPVAFVVLEPKSNIVATDILRMFMKRTAKFKIPKDIVFTDELPRNAMGKILKYELRKRLSRNNSNSH